MLAVSNFLRNKYIYYLYFFLDFFLFLQDVINYNCRSLVAAVPFFTNAAPEFVSSVVTKLIYEVFQPGEFYFKFGYIQLRYFSCFAQRSDISVVECTRICSTKCLFFGLLWLVDILMTQNTDIFRCERTY